jgi:hypothetical protein
MAPPGIGPGTYVASNDGVFYGMARGDLGGSWPGGFAPFLIGSPAQGRPPIVPTNAVPGATNVAFLGAQDGYAYAVDANTGNLLWTSPQLGDAVQAPLGGMFTRFGGIVDYAFAGSLNSVGPNTLFALAASDGSVAASFDNGGGVDGLGVIGGGVAVVYGASPKVYFTSRALSGGSSNTLWCLDLAPGSLTLDWAVPAGDTDAAPVVRNGRVYVGTNAGEVEAYDAATGGLLWTFATGDGAVKGFVFPDRLTTGLYFATTTTVWGISDDGAAASQLWPEVSTIPDPSVVLFLPGGTRLWVGSSDGSLHQIDFAGAGAPPGGPAPVVSSVVLGDGGAAVGTPSFDVATGLIYVGTDAGVVYAIEDPIN